MRSCKLCACLGLLLGSAVWLQGCKPAETKPAAETAAPAAGAPAGEAQPEPTGEPLGSG
ncbi:MAG: hypothetical protein JNG90_02945 [Planctomycetaceae bacterium]|nr:hypothetical protein [Planctomycetaceae bacterium]